MTDQEKASKRGRSSRTRGHSWERFVSAALRMIWPDARRHLEYQDGEANGIDIANTGETFRIQCKSTAKVPNIPQVFKEIRHDQENIPVVIFKVTGKGEYACFKFEDAKLLMGIFEKAERFGK